MKSWPILLACLTTCTLATQVTYQTSSSSQSSSSTNQQQQQWSWQGQDLLGAPNTQEESYHPVSFTAPDAVKQEQSQQQQPYNPNVQSQSSGVAEAFDQRTVDSVIDNILIYNRQGRNLEGYDELYADPDVKNALQLGNDTVARSYIKEKLCSLGLMNCENLEGRRPYYSPHRDIHPHDVIYAQPVTIKPVGRPLPAVPVKRPYRFGKPESLSPGFAPGPILSGPPPSFIGAGHGPIYSRPPSSFLGSQIGLKKPGGGPIYATKPIYEPGLDAEVDFENKYLNKKQVILQQPGGPVQQHVHHHYHHGDSIDNAGSTPIIGPGPIGNNGFNAYGYGNGGSYAGTINDFEDYRKNFKIKTSSSGNNLNEAASSNSYANAFSTYEKVKGDSTVGGSNSLHTGKQYPGFGASNPYIANNNFASNGNNFAGNLGSLENAFNNGLSSSSYEDCVCVPYEQCSTIDHVGRKDDLYLAIDPRNLGKNIEAETVEVVITDGNGTMSIVKVPKGVNATNSVGHRKEQDNNGEISDSEENNDFVASDKRTKRDTTKRAEQKEENKVEAQSRQFGRPPVCGPRHVCCRSSHVIGSRPRPGQCGTRYTKGVNARIKTPAYIDGDSEFGEYPWQVAILKKDSTESVYVCGGTLISPRHIITAAHCVKTYAGRDLRARLGEWDVNHDVEFYPYIERDIVSVYVHPEFYAGTLYNDIAILKLDHPIDFDKNPHITPACLPNKRDDFNGARCWTTGWGKDAFGEFGKYQNILKEVDVPIINNQVCESQMRRTRLGTSFNLHPGFICAGGEEGKDACKGDGGGPMVCERNGQWQLAGVVSWGIGCGQAGVPGVYSRVSFYLDWIRQVIDQY
ncbi:uncharacterized protein LOC124428207 [Vespa crabro]|uniref:uncharacterized protein LOC124428207 n=1 Tax=Vespa crabro TaxID=7445 RepID=UPI001F00B06A|nr:uncharacterized protein LOC124428207 [Vespa crabro]XP_046827989.1 uncharacterized protein LOC124428207 [Vespa crabro]